MSVKVQGWVWDQPLPTSEKIVLLKLADHADHEGGNVYPSVAGLAEQTGLSTRQVQRHLKSFVSRGILTIERNEFGGRGQTRIYRFTFNPIEPQKSDTHVTLSNAETVTPVSPIVERKGDIRDSVRVTSETERVTPMSQKGDIAMSPEPSLTVTEPSENRHGSDSGQVRSDARSMRSIPKNFTPSPRFEVWRQTNGFTAEQVANQLEVFRSHSEARDTRNVDWDAAFRTWMIRARQWGHLEDKKQPQNMQTHGHDDNVDWFGEYGPKAASGR